MYNKSKFIESLNENQRKAFKFENIDVLRDMDIADPRKEEEKQEDADKKKKTRKHGGVNLGTINKK